MGKASVTRRLVRARRRAMPDYIATRLDDLRRAEAHRRPLRAGRVYSGSGDYSKMLKEMGEQLFAGYRVQIERLGWKRYRMAVLPVAGQRNVAVA
jgi:hypothetical protein